MADNLQIKLSVTGSDELDSLIKKFNEGKATTKDWTQIIKGLNAEANKAREIFGNNSTQVKEYNKAIAVVRDTQKDLRLETRAGHEAYFKAGLELRQLALAGNLLSGEFGKLSNAISGSVLNAVQLKQTLVPLGIQMTGLGIGIAAAASAGVMFISWLIDSKKKAQETAEEIRKLRQQYIDLQFELTKAPVSLQINEAQARIMLLEKQKAVPTSQQVPVGGSMMGGFKTVVTPLTPEEIKKNQEIDIEITQEKLKVERLRESNIDKEYQAALERARSSGMPFMAPPGFQPSTAPRSETSTGLPSYTPVPVSVQEAVDGMARAKAQAAELSQTLKQGANSFSSTLINSLVQGRDLAQSIGLALLGVLVNYATGFIGGRIYNAINPSAPSVADSPIVSIQKSSAGGRMQQPQLLARVQGTDLLVMLDNSSAVLAGRTY